MRTTAFARMLVVWIAILAIHLIAPNAWAEVAGVVLVVLVLIDWVRPPDNANLVAAGNLWAALTLGFDAILRRPLDADIAPLIFIAISPLLAARVRHALHV